MEQKARKSARFIGLVMPLLMLGVLFFGCGVLPPVISSITVSPSNRVIAENAVSISAEATSGSGLALSYTWSATGGSLSSNTGKSVIWTAPSSPGVYSITLVVSDGTNSVSDTINIVVVDPDAPIINSLVASPNPVAVGKTSTVTCTATDPNDLSMSYAWEATSGSILSGGSAMTWKAPTSPGVYTITAIVTNTKKTSVSESINIEVVNPLPPVISNLAASGSSVDSDGTITLTCYATDPYGLELTYTWSASSSGGGASGTFTGDGNSVTWNAPTVTSTKDVNLTVTVSNGSVTSTKSVTVTVRSD